MWWYRGQLIIAYMYLLTTLTVALDDDGSKEIENQRRSSALGLFDRPVTSTKECVDTKLQCPYWECKYDFIRRWCPKKCGLCNLTSTALPTTTGNFQSSTIKTPTTYSASTEKIATTHGSTAPSTASPKTTHHGTINTPTTHKMSTEKIPTTHDSTTENLRTTHSSAVSTTASLNISTLDIKTPKEEPVTTRHRSQSTHHNTEIKRNSSSPITLPETATSTNQTSNKSPPNAYARYVKSRSHVAMVTGIAVGCLLVVVVFFICKRRKKRSNAQSFVHEPETIITMQPFNYTRDKSRDAREQNATQIYEESHGKKVGTHFTSRKRVNDADLKDDEPFYYVLEGNTQHHVQSSQNHNIYACADCNGHENKAFDLSDQTLNSQTRLGVLKYETVAAPSGHDNQQIQGENYFKDDFEKPYYHVLEKRTDSHSCQEDCDGGPLPVYQPLIGVRKNATRNATEICHEYQPLTGIRSKGARMS